MKELLLIRHAKSSWTNPGLKDEERPLNKRGERDAPFMASFCKKLNINITHLYSSTAVRAYSTAEYFKKEFEVGLEKETNLYFGDETDWMYLINNLEETVGLPAFFSHNPTITFFANSFEGNYIENVPTCGIVHLKSDAQKWLDVGVNNTRIKNTYFPKLVR